MKFTCLLLAFVVLIAVFDTAESRSQMVNEIPETDLIFEFIGQQEENIENQILNVENQNLNIEHQRDNILEQEINIGNLKSDLENHNMAYEVDTDDYKMKKRTPRRYGYKSRYGSDRRWLYIEYLSIWFIYFH